MLLTGGLMHRQNCTIKWRWRLPLPFDEMTLEAPSRGAQKQFSKMPLLGFLCPAMELFGGSAKRSK
jgi:hypothetical protein